MRRRQMATVIAAASLALADPPEVMLLAGAVPEVSQVELRGEAQITVEAGDTAAKGPPKFNMLAYTGVAMAAHTEPKLPHPVVIDLAGLDTAKQERPVLKDHDQSKLVGHTSSIKTDGQSLVAAGLVSGTGEAAKEVAGAAANGFKWPVSVGAVLKKLEFVKPGASVTVNGRSVQGPVFIARASALREISFLTVAADDDAVASIAATGRGKDGVMTPFELWLASLGLSLEALSEEQVTKLTAKFEADKKLQAGGGGSGGSGDGAGDETLEEILRVQRDKDKKRKEITTLAAQFIHDCPGRTDMIEAFARQAFAGDWSKETFELHVLRATRQNGHTVTTLSSEEVSGQVMEAALCIAGGLPEIEKHFTEPILVQAQRSFRHGLGLGETLRYFANRNGYNAMSNRNVEPLLRAAFAPDRVVMTASGISTLSLPGILSNVANKFLKLGFDSVENTWRLISSTTPVNDFKQITSYTLGGDFKYKKVPKGGDLEHAVPGETSYTNQADTYGRLFAVDRRDIINDNLGALTAAPRKLGRGAALEFNVIFWTEFLADHTTFFPTNGSKGNYLSGATVGTNDSRMNIEGLSRAEEKFFSQTDPDGNPLGVLPQLLLVPNALNADASALMRSTSVLIGATTSATQAPVVGESNPHAGKFTVVRSAYLSNSAMGGGFSALAWYLLANPNDLSFIDTCFLNGVETPTVETADAEFKQLGIQMRGYHDFGVNKQEYRAAVKSKGAA